MRADLRCRWCGEWLTPEHIADGETYCCPEHAVTSLDRQYARPSHHPDPLPQLQEPADR